MKHLHLTRVLAFALALVLLLGCTACGKKTADDTGDTVGQKDTQTTVELDGKFTLNYSASAGMNPYKTQNSDNLAVCGLVYETLTELTDAFEAEPGLFTKWSSDDGETWTFTVNTDRTFHDGHQLNAQDAAYTIQTAAASPLYAGRLSAVKDVTDNDDGTVTVTLSRANTQFPALLNIPVIENNAADSAYPSGTVSNDWTTYTLAMDRGVKFALDRTSPNDTNFLATAENVIREFARNALVREQDAYRIQKLYALANADTAHKGTHIVSAALTKSNIIEKVCGLLQTVRDDAEVMDGYVALVSHKNKSAFLAAATGTYHSITFGAGVSINGVTYDNVMLLDDLPCIFVPQSRMKTAVTVQTGSGNSGGIVSATGAQDINVLLAHCSAPLAVSKLDSIKQFGPEENQFFDGTAIQARYLYDLFVPTKSVVSIGAIVEPAAAAGSN